MKLPKSNQSGMILLVFLITIPFLILVATYYLHLSLTSYQVARFDQLHTEAQLTADAGADYAIEQINQNNSWAGTGGEVQLHTDSSLKTTYSVSVVNPSATSKTLTIIGRTYWPLNSPTANRSVTIIVSLRAVESGNFSIVSGEGGLNMSNSSKIVGGNVLVNGQINLSNSAQIGLSTNPVGVQVADQACPNPADSTYPRVCNSGENGQPITISNTAHIYGAVKATNQTNGSGMSNTGLVAGSTVTPQALPTYDRSAQIAAVPTDSSHNLTGSAASCSGSQALTWPANTKITGDVTISGQCQVDVLGNVWITGSLTVSNIAKLVVDNTLSTTVPVIMVDGSSGVNLSNGSQLVANSSSTGFEIITYWSAATCSPNCTTVTGTDLYNSQSVTTISLNNSSNAPDTILYAYWSQVSVSNAGQIGALIGQTVQLTNNSAVTFGTSGAGTGTITWVVNGYRRT